LLSFVWWDIVDSIFLLKAVISEPESKRVVCFSSVSLFSSKSKRTHVITIVNKYIII
jgi:hypothetical protein